VGDHTLSANVNAANRIVESSSTNNSLAATIAVASTPPKSDLVVTAVTPAAATTGANVVPSATVKNTGTGATPAGTILDVAFQIEGTTVWSDTNTASLAPGASVTLTANTGDAGHNYWVTTVGNHTLTATVNSAGRIVESNTANNTLAATVTVTTPATGGGTQPVLAWLGVVAMDNLIANNAGGITLDTLASHGVAGSVISTGHLQDSYPSWMVSEFSTVKAHGLLYVGANVAGPLPQSDAEWATSRNQWTALTNAAKAAGADGMAIDAEPYTQEDTHWQGSDHAGMYNQARLLAPILKSAGKLIIYPSSAASFVGSYNDLIVTQAGRPNFYANSRFPDFLQGLIDGGVDITLLDASFHFGVQYAPDQGNWGSGIARSVSLTHDAYPTMHASAMLWPDIDEGRSQYGIDEFQSMVAAGLPKVDGPFVIYQHHLTDSSLVSSWNGYLNAIDAAVRSVG
jgi:hypothetical protein